MPEAVERQRLLEAVNSPHLSSLSTARDDFEPDLESPTVPSEAAGEDEQHWRKPAKRRGPLDVAQVHPLFLSQTARATASLISFRAVQDLDFVQILSYLIEATNMMLQGQHKMDNG